MGGTKAPAMTVRPSDTLSHVIGKLNAAKVHRVYVVDGNQLISVISLTDILRYAYMTSHRHASKSIEAPPFFRE
jgi:CBS domain-containing protein